MAEGVEEDSLATPSGRQSMPQCSLGWYSTARARLRERTARSSSASSQPEAVVCPRLEGSGRELLGKLCEARKKSGSSLGVAHIDWLEQPTSEDEVSASAFGRSVRAKARNSVRTATRPGPQGAAERQGRDLGPRRTDEDARTSLTFRGGKEAGAPHGGDDPDPAQDAVDCEGLLLVLGRQRGLAQLRGARAADELVQTHRARAERDAAKPQGRQHQRREARRATAAPRALLAEGGRRPQLVLLGSEAEDRPNSRTGTRRLRPRPRMFPASPAGSRTSNTRKAWATGAEDAASSMASQG